MTTGRERVNQFIDGIASYFVILIITAIGAVFINWMTQGEFIRFLHGTTQDDMKYYARIDDLKLNITYGSWSGLGTYKPDGIYSVFVAQEACHEGILISAYCSPNTQAIEKGASGQIRIAGLSGGKYYCQWANIEKPELFTAQAQAICLTVSAKK